MVAVGNVSKRWLERHFKGRNGNIFRKNKHWRQGDESKESPNQLLRMKLMFLERAVERRKQFVK